MIHTKVGQVGERLIKSSLFCKALYGALLIGFALSFSQTLYRIFAITPRLLFPPNFWLWTVLTYFLVEQNFLVLLCDLGAVYLCGSVLEPLWNNLDLLIYFLIVNSSVAVASTLQLFSLYFFVENTDLIFEITIHGLSGFVGALLVAVKQIVPDSTLVPIPGGRLKNTHLPALVCLLLTVLCVVRVVKPIVICMYLNGAFFGWIYLRYYQPHQNGSQGDMQDQFSFASFFPSALQPAMEVVSGVLYRILVRLKVCRPAIRQFDVSQLQAVTVHLPDVEPQDAERRRQKALKELQDRLNKTRESGLAAWPAMDESPGTHQSGASPTPAGGPPPESPVEEEGVAASPPGAISEPKLVLQTSGSEMEEESSGGGPGTK